MGRCRVCGRVVKDFELTCSPCRKIDEEFDSRAFKFEGDE